MTDLERSMNDLRKARASFLHTAEAFASDPLNTRIVASMQKVRALYLERRSILNIGVAAIRQTGNPYAAVETMKGGAS